MSIEVLGRLAVGGRDLTGSVARSLLTALVVHLDTGASSDLLIDVAWPDEPPANPTAALQSQISRLRARVGKDALVTAPTGYRLVLGPDGLDAAAFAHEVDLARDAVDSAERLAVLDGALARWRGRPFAECGDLHVAMAERTRIEAIADHARRRRVESLSELERYDEMIETTDVTDTWIDDHTIALVAIATGAVSGSAAGLRVLHDYRTRLIEETGTEPGDVYREAEVRLLRDDLPHAKRRPDERATPRRRDDGPAPRRQPLRWYGSIESDIPLVGRLRARRLLLQHLDHLDTGVGRVVALVGEAGVGKSRLVDNLRSEAEQRGLQVAAANCIAGGLFRSPILELVDELVGRQSIGPSGDGETSTPSAAAAELDAAEVGRAAAAELLQAVEKPTLVVVEDVHDADLTTRTALDLLRELAPRAGRPLLVLTTSRDVAATPPDAIVVPPHRVDEIAAMIRSAAGLRPSQRLIQHALERTGGNALALVTGLRSLALQERFVVVDDELDLDDDTAATLLSATTDHAVAAHLDQVPAERRRLLTQLANLAPSVPLGVAASALDTDVATLLDAMSHDDVASLVTIRDGSIAFSHANVRLAIGDAMPAAERHVLHDRVVRLLGQPFTDEETMTMAWHAARSSEPDRATGIFGEAARLSMARCDWSTALVYFHLATDIDAPPAASAVGAGEAAFRSFDAAESDRWYANGAARARDERDLDGWVRCVLGRERARLTAAGVGSVDLGAIEELVDQTAERPELHAALCSLLAEVSFADRRIDRARHWTERAVAAADAADDESAAATVAFSAGLTMLGALDLAQAVDHFARCDRLSLAAGEPWMASWSRTRSALALLMAGDLDEATAMVRRAREVAELNRGSADLSLAMAVDGNVRLIRGDVDEALLLAAEAESHWHRSRYPFSSPILFPVLAECWRQSDDAGEALATLDRWRDAKVAGSTPWYMLHDAVVGAEDELRRRQRERPLRLPPVSDLQLGNCAIAAILVHTGLVLGGEEPIADAMATLLDRGVEYVPGFSASVDELLVSAADIPPSSF